MLSLQNSGQYQTQYLQLRRETYQSESNRNSAGTNKINNSGQTNSDPDNKMPSMTILTVQTTDTTGNQELFVHPLRPLSKRTNPKKCYFGANAANRLPPRKRRQTGQIQNQRQDTQKNTSDSVHAAAQTLN